jgi:putative ABC transport system substrate-binding protein
MLRAAVAFTSEHSTVCYLPAHRISYNERCLAVLTELTVKSGLATRAEIESGRPGPGSSKAIPPMTAADSAAPVIRPHFPRDCLPAVYGNSAMVRDGSLLSYGPDSRDMFRRAAPYVDRILRGAKPVELPVQLPTRFEMALNAKTAKALGLTVPPSILVRADEVID